jgi:DivIVA domain-containing protein
VALDRQSIEKKDFPVGRRGYDPEAVDAHLSALADEVAEFRHTARRRSDTLASSASEQVRAIVEAAETSAGDIQRAAEDDAREIREEASVDAQSTREQAADQAREYVDKVSQATKDMLQRLEAMENEFGTLMEALRTGSNRLTADLQLLEGNLAEVSAATLPHRTFDAEAGELEVEEVEEVVIIEAEAGDPTEPVAIGGDGEAVGMADDVEALGGESDAEQLGAADTDDVEGARLIALNMALNGTPREETDRYLSENFQLSDRDGLLDEVYASVDA